MSCRYPAFPPLPTSLVLCVLLIGPGCECRYSTDSGPTDVEISGDLVFEPVPVGTVASRTLRVHGSAAAPDVSGADSSLAWRWLAGGVGAAAQLVVSCDPSMAEQNSGAIELTFGGNEPISVDWTCASGDRPEGLPEALLETIALQSFTSVAESQLGDAAIADDDGGRIVLNPSSGDVFLADPVAGRLWRQDPGYVVPGWGVWQPLDFELYERWFPYPPCITDELWNRQSGTCTGEERNNDGEIPQNWAFVHSGFIGDADNDLQGVRTGVALPDLELIVGVGERDDEGFVAVVDAGLAMDLGDEHPYTYLQLVRPTHSEQPLPVGLQIAASTTGAWLLEPNTGAVWQLQELDQVRPLVVRASIEVGAVSRWASLPQVLLMQRDDGSWATLGGSGLTELDAPDGWGSLSSEPPDLLAGDGEVVWGWYAEPGLLAWWELGSGLGGLMVPPAAVQGLHHLAADRISGGDAPTSSMAWLVAQTAGGPVLLGAQAEHNAVELEGLPLPAVPVDIAVDVAPHDLYVAWAAGAEGCDGEWADLCSAGEHPALLGSYYAAYGLVPPTSTGHPLNMFLNPILETPKDYNINSDFSRGEGRCEPAPDDFDAQLFEGCCALSWATRDRVVPSLDYVVAEWLAVGADTETDDDDVAVVVGLNPTWLRQARMCYAEDLTASQGYDALEILARYRDQGLGFTHWTHTSMADADATEPMDYFMSLLYEAGVDYEFPMDSQAEYQMLHDGMYAAARYDDLPDYDDDGVIVDMTTLEVPLQAISGNHFDGAVMVSDDGWPDGDPSWNRAGRDGPLALGDAPFEAYYFASMGTDPTVGLDGFRKKELLPSDIRHRAAAFEMGEAPEDWFGGGDADVLYLPGHSWALNTQGDLHEGGLFRESQIWGTETEERDWDAVIRYLRRIVASSQPDDIKVWYLHIFDFTNISGLIEDNSSVTEQLDINVNALEAINALLVTPGHARWADPDAMVDEWRAADGKGETP